MRKYRAKFFYISILFLFVLFLTFQPGIGYNLYINSHLVGTVHSRAEARTILDIAAAEMLPSDFSPSLYPRFVSQKKYTAAADILQNAQKALGFETEVISETVAVPFSREAIQDSALYEGETRIQTEGKAGKRTVIKQIIKQNGVFLREEILSDKIITEPVTEVSLVGVREKPAGLGSGEFILPLQDVTVSSDFGERWGRQHEGIDFAAETGTPILAADSGTVTFSGACEGYGNLIILDHKNGLSSYYAHCSALYAEVGATIKKGEIIAAVGNTGNSTGPHLHFEIRKNDIPQDPMLFLE